MSFPRCSSHLQVHVSTLYARSCCVSSTVKKTARAREGSRVCINPQGLTGHCYSIPTTPQLAAHTLLKHLIVAINDTDLRPARVTLWRASVLHFRACSSDACKLANANGRQPPPTRSCTFLSLLFIVKYSFAHFARKPVGSWSAEAGACRIMKAISAEDGAIVCRCGAGPAAVRVTEAGWRVTQASNSLPAGLPDQLLVDCLILHHLPNQGVSRYMTLLLPTVCRRREADAALGISRTGVNHLLGEQTCPMKYNCREGERASEREGGGGG